ncbi:hypothetical protein E1B28_013002 [Marasmius oreades]|uniref:Uncharacterized protein n=1 Tax=Marasmius oreades TaxID=181124 RepID=A0A9P7RPL0_9AGAR|nr:uncharacterized protein E1B28_013002 [Marasmius oreades]KAG7087023.1 hypothetical protein E1B28_013002 [Marasmius oreades]
MESSSGGSPAPITLKGRLTEELDVGLNIFHLEEDSLTLKKFPFVFTPFQPRSVPKYGQTRMKEVENGHRCGVEKGTVQPIGNLVDGKEEDKRPMIPAPKEVNTRCHADRRDQCLVREDVRQ